MAGDCKRLYKQMQDHESKTGTSPTLDYQLLGPPATLGVSPSSSSATSNSHFHTYMLNNQNNQNHNNNNNNESMNENEADCSTSATTATTSNLIMKKTLFYLISTLNASFSPDYDFSNTSSSEFSKEPSLDYLKEDIENNLASIEVYGRLKQQLWEAIDQEINLAECEFYR